MIRLHHAYLGRPRNFTGLHVWARGYGGRTVSCEAAVMRQYSRTQAEPEKGAEPLALGDCAPRKAGKHPQGAGPGSPSAPGGGLSSQGPLKRAFYNSTLLQGGILKPPALRVVVGW